MFTEFLSFLQKNGFSEWQIMETSEVLPRLSLPEYPFHINVEETYTLLNTHSHLFMALYPIPGPESHRVAQEGPEIAPFAQRHYYREAASLLIEAFSLLRKKSSISRRDVRIFCNSRFPEKELARIAGLGFIGRHTLLIHPKIGSSFIIAGAAISLSGEQGDSIPLLKSRRPSLPGCGSCRACIQACPTRAIHPDHRDFDRNRCLQYLSTEIEGWDDGIRRKWDTRLYGCMECQRVCPWNSKLPTQAGKRYEYIPLIQQFAGGIPMKEIFAGTALEAAWVPRTAILRNLITAAANSGLNEKDARTFYTAACSVPESENKEIRESLRWFRTLNPTV